VKIFKRTESMMQRLAMAMSRLSALTAVMALIEVDDGPPNLDELRTLHWGVRVLTAAIDDDYAPCTPLTPLQKERYTYEIQTLRNVQSPLALSDIRGYLAELNRGNRVDLAVAGPVVELLVGCISETAAAMNSELEKHIKLADIEELEKSFRTTQENDAEFEPEKGGREAP